MKIKRNRRGGQKSGFILSSGLRGAFIQHLRKNGASYAPAVSPLVFFFLAHILTFVLSVSMKAGLLPENPVVCKTLVTWAFYGFLPLLLCSYVAFYGVARPMVDLVARRFPAWTDTLRNLALGGIYGAAIVTVLFLFFKPHTLASFLSLFFISLAVGQGNWFFYSRLVSVNEESIQK